MGVVRHLQGAMRQAPGTDTQGTGESTPTGWTPLVLKLRTSHPSHCGASPQHIEDPVAMIWWPPVPPLKKIVPYAVIARFSRYRRGDKRRGRAGTSGGDAHPCIGYCCKEVNQIKYVLSNHTSYIPCR
jgi:hypothetical protein